MYTVHLSPTQPNGCLKTNTFNLTFKLYGSVWALAQSLSRREPEEPEKVFLKYHE